MYNANSHWSYATSIKSTVIVTLSPVIPLYILERSPPSAGLKAVWSAFTIGEAKLAFTTAAMLSEGEETFRERSLEVVNNNGLFFCTEARENVAQRNKPAKKDLANYDTSKHIDSSIILHLSPLYNISVIIQIIITKSISNISTGVPYLLTSKVRLRYGVNSKKASGGLGKLVYRSSDHTPRVQGAMNSFKQKRSKV